MVNKKNKSSIVALVFDICVLAYLISIFTEPIGSFALLIAALVLAVIGPLFAIKSWFPSTLAAMTIIIALKHQICIG